MTNEPLGLLHHKEAGKVWQRALAAFRKSEQSHPQGLFDAAISVIDVALGVEYRRGIKDATDSTNKGNCQCEFDYPEGAGKEAWRYLRTCLVCGYQWGGLHCPHDRYQNPCPRCKTKPETE